MYRFYCFFVLFSLMLPADSQGQDHPYAGQQHRQIKSLSSQEITDLRQGKGMGLAKVAELNHYPGPRHLLDAAKDVGLSLEQKQSIQALYNEMQSKASALGHQTIRAENRLDKLFSGGAIDQVQLETSLAEIGRLRSDLRFIHLEIHLRTRPLLTEEQNALYNQLRG